MRESNIVSLYADDLLLYVSNPATAIPFVISILNEFGSFSGYKLNLQKSECFPLNIPPSDLPQLNLPFCIIHSGFKYLGVNIPSSISAVLAANFTPLLNQTKSDLQRWGNLPLTLTEFTLISLLVPIHSNIFTEILSIVKQAYYIIHFGWKTPQS